MEQFHGIFALKTSLLHAVLDNCTHSQLTFDIKHWVEIIFEDLSLLFYTCKMPAFMKWRCLLNTCMYMWNTSICEMPSHVKCQRMWYVSACEMLTYLKTVSHVKCCCMWNLNKICEMPVNMKCDARACETLVHMKYQCMWNNEPCKLCCKRYASAFETPMHVHLKHRCMWN